MKAKLLKKLRKEAFARYYIKIFLGDYYVEVKDDAVFGTRAGSLTEAKRNLKQERDSYILREVRKLRDEKMNEELRKL